MYLCSLGTLSVFLLQFRRRKTTVLFSLGITLFAILNIFGLFPYAPLSLMHDFKRNSLVYMKSQNLVQCYSNALQQDVFVGSCNNTRLHVLYFHSSRNYTIINHALFYSFI